MCLPRMCRPKEGIGSPAARVTNGCELPNVGSGNWTWSSWLASTFNYWSCSLVPCFSWILRTVIQPSGRYPHTAWNFWSVSIFIPRRCVLRNDSLPLITGDFSFPSQMFYSLDQRTWPMKSTLHMLLLFPKMMSDELGFQLLLVPPGCPFETKLRLQLALI